MALVRQQLPSNNFDFFICGPAAMMSDLKAGLLEWGVSTESIYLEAFGPSSVKQARTSPAVPAEPRPKVVFGRSNHRVAWTGEADSLLDLSLAEGIAISYGCRAGNCGTCKTTIKCGKVKYLKRPGCAVEEGICLACIAVPDGDILLDL